MKAQSAKNKGRRLQQLIRDAILSVFPSLTTDDVRSCPMGSHGADIQLSAAARQAFPYSVECKARTGTTTLYSWYEQAGRHGQDQAVVFIKGDRRKPLVLLDAGHFLRLVSR